LKSIKCPIVELLFFDQSGHGKNVTTYRNLLLYIETEFNQVNGR